MKEPPAKVLTGLPGTGNVMDLKGGDPILASVAGKSKAPAAIGGIPEPPPPTPLCQSTIDSWKSHKDPALRAYAATCDCRNGPNAQPVCGAVQPPPVVEPPPVVVPPPVIQPPPTVQPPPAAQPPAKKPGFFAKVGKWIWNNILKPIWDNLIKPIVDLFVGIYHKIKGDTKCGNTWYNADKEFCMNGTAFEKCGGESYNPDTECCLAGKKQEKCGGECYNPVNTCCTNGKKSDDMFSSTEFLLENCPNRIARTEDRTGVSNGCSVPNSVKAVLQAIALAQGRWIWDFNDPVGGGESTTFRYACDAHDACYADCNNKSVSNLIDSAKQGQCDKNMLENKMDDVCNKLGDPKAYKSCTLWKTAYLAGVWLKGETHYTAAQKEWCKCCPAGSK
mgnify:CR=1 FL=1